MAKYFGIPKMSTDKLFGDRLAQSLRSLGIPKAKVERWLGRPCGCSERQQKLNQLHIWLKRFLSGKEINPKPWAEDMMDQSEDSRRTTVL